MKLIKLWYHIVAAIQCVFYKLLYGSRLQIGKNVTWRRNFSIMMSKEARLVIGDNCFFNNDCSIAVNNLVEIGVSVEQSAWGGTIFGENVKIYDHNHRFQNGKPIKEQGYSNGEVHIGGHCWIGSGVIILKNANISDNCVIGAGCVVSERIPEGSVVVANRSNMITKIRREAAGEATCTEAKNSGVAQ